MPLPAMRSSVYYAFDIRLQAQNYLFIAVETIDHTSKQRLFDVRQYPIQFIEASIPNGYPPLSTGLMVNLDSGAQYIA